VGGARTSSEIGNPLPPSGAPCRGPQPGRTEPQHVRRLYAGRSSPRHRDSAGPGRLRPDDPFRAVPIRRLEPEHR
jgi:hypothetical protein